MMLLKTCNNYIKVTTLFICLFMASNNLAGQGFELIFGEDRGDNKPYKVLNIPNENAYLVVYKGPTRFLNTIDLKISKIDSLGNVVFTKAYPYSYFLNSLPQFLELDHSFKIGFTEGNSLLILEFDYEGNLLDKVNFRTYGRHNILREVRFTSDHSTVFLESVSVGSDYGKLRKIAPDGTLVWENSMAFKAESFRPLIHILPNDEILVYSEYYDGTTTMHSLYKFNKEGNQVWENTEVSNFGFDHFILPFPDLQTYLVYGDLEPSSGFGTNLAAVNADGTLLWKKDFTAHLNFIDKSGVIPGESNTVYLCGKVFTQLGSQLVLLQLDVDGNIIWKKLFANNGFNSINEGQLMRDKDNGFVIATEYYPGSGYSSDPYVFKCDKDGEVVWSYGKPREDHYQHLEMIPTGDNGYIILGKRELYSEEFYRLVVTKLDAEGNIYSRVVNGFLGVDENLSCTLDTSETRLSNWLLRLQGEKTFLTTTNNDGYFSFGCNADTVFAIAIPYNDLWEACPENIPIVFDEVYDTSDISFTMQAVDQCPALEVDISTALLRRCFDNIYYLTIKNNGTVPAENTQIEIMLDSYFIFKNISTPNFSFSNQVITLHPFDIPVGASYQFSIEIEVSCDAPLGHLHCTKVTSTVDNNCINSLYPLAYQHTETSECQRNRGSYDPNEKRAYSAGVETDQFILEDTLIEYQVKFQNTGTDTAFKVVITDTLSSYLDLSTFKLGAFSHPVKVEMLPSRSLRFTFDNIMLPDSNINEPASHGFVKFKIRPLPSFAEGKVIENTAAIFFDFNDPIITNQVDLQYEPLISVSPEVNSDRAHLLIHPQPAINFVNFSLENGHLTGNSKLTLTLHDLRGQQVKEFPFPKPSYRIYNLKQGLYFYRLTNELGTIDQGKLIIVGD